MVTKILYGNLKVEQLEPIEKPHMTSTVPEEQEVPAPLVITVGTVTTNKEHIRGHL